MDKIASALARHLDLGALAALTAQAHSCPLQDPFRIRARFIGWKVASLLIDEGGELRRDLLASLIEAFSKTPYSLEGDTWIYSHLLASLKLLSEDGIFWKTIKKCSLPLFGKAAEPFIRDTLWPHEVGSLSNAHIRRAVLTAWFSLLRQAIGSCFATAPAIWIQRYDPRLLLEDLESILSTGELRRAGFTAPFCASMGLGEWLKPFGLLSPSASPGLRAAFHAVGLRLPDSLQTAPEDTPEKILSQALLSHFELTQADLAAEASSLLPNFAVMWERMGGRLEAQPRKSIQIEQWKKAKDRAQRAFLSLSDCALLRAWEYTLASFCDIKIEVSRWNVYISLGLHPDEGGIGKFLLTNVQKNFAEANQRFDALHEERRRLIGAAQAAERLLKNGETRYEVQSEFHSAVHAANRTAELIEETALQSDFFAKIFEQIFHAMLERFDRFFQEVFDPALTELGGGLFEDSPAGFRLVCKHDRSTSSSWERIETPQQFVEGICRLLEALERELPVDRKQRDAFSLLITETMQFVRSVEFIEGATLRSQKHERSSPWAYVSGGTMQTLVQSYFGLAPKQFAHDVQSEKDLLHFLIEAAKRSNGRQALLMASPTHAFLLHPEWLTRVDLERSARFVKQLDISPERLEFLVDRFAQKIPEIHQSLFYHRFRQSEMPQDLAAFRRILWESAGGSEEVVDGFLYESLPVFSLAEAKRACQMLQEALFSQHRIKIKVSQWSEKISFLTSSELLSAIHPTEEHFSSIDWERELIEEARRQGILYPDPILFGDTNWSNWCFGFVQNLATGKLELWRLDRLGKKGAPMSEWRSHLTNGSRWTVFL